MTGVQARARAGNLKKWARLYELIGQSIREGELSYQEVAQELGIELALARALWPRRGLDELIGRWLLEGVSLVREPDAELKVAHAYDAFRVWVFSLDGGPTLEAIQRAPGVAVVMDELKERLVREGARWDSHRRLLRGVRLI